MLRRYQEHRSRCETCRPAGRNRCVDGTRLADLYARTQRTEPVRRAMRAADEEFDRLASWVSREAYPRRRAGQWANVLPSVRDADADRAAGAASATTRPADLPYRPSPRSPLQQTRASLTATRQQLASPYLSQSRRSEIVDRIRDLAQAEQYLLGQKQPRTTR